MERAILVLIPKAKGQLDVKRPKARPICLLNDIGKFFERILDRRLKLFKAGVRSTCRSARVLKSGMQFGLTEGVSTVDALSAVTDYINEKLDKKLLVIAVSLDIKNAFNSVRGAQFVGHWRGMVILITSVVSSMGIYMTDLLIIEFAPVI